MVLRLLVDLGPQQVVLNLLDLLGQPRASSPKKNPTQPRIKPVGSGTGTTVEAFYSSTTERPAVG